MSDANKPSPVTAEQSAAIREITTGAHGVDGEPSGFAIVDGAVFINGERKNKVGQRSLFGMPLFNRYPISMKVGLWGVMISFSCMIFGTVFGQHAITTAGMIFLPISAIGFFTALIMSGYEPFDE